jgi:hypothetical protein
LFNSCRRWWSEIADLDDLAMMASWFLEIDGSSIVARAQRPPNFLVDAVVDE